MRIAAWTLLTALATGLTAHAGATFTFNFDDYGPGPPPATPPFVGTGTLTLANDPGAGPALDSVGGFSIAFNIAGDLYTDADIQTTLSTVQLVVTADASGEHMQFSNIFAVGDGPDLGSIDFVNSLGENLSFEPPAAGGLNLYYETGEFVYGNYSADDFSAVAAMEPGTLSASVLGVVSGLCYGVRRLRRKTSPEIATV